MRLAAIYNVWDGDELLLGSIQQIYDHVDVIIIVYQLYSNFGERYNPITGVDARWFEHYKLRMQEYIPIQGIGGASNERAKRNLGIKMAQELECTHFFHIDVDEYYEDFKTAKQLYLDSGRNGSACKLYTYFKDPTLRFENPDNYYVPFIHKLTPETTSGMVREYPFYVDPTRRINETDVVELPIFMHHFSWVRRDIMRKVRNSSAKFNIERTTLVADYLSEATTEGTLVRDYQNMRLVRVPNQFNIQL